MKRKRLIGAIATAGTAAAICAGVALGSAGTQTTPSTSAPSGAQAAHPGPPGMGMGMGMGGEAVHSVGVVLDKAGTAYVTQTSDRGTVESIDTANSTVTLVEGTKSVTYKTVTLSVPSDATVTLDAKTSALSDLAAGDQVTVSSSLDGTVVMAVDSSFQPEGGPGANAAKGHAPPGGEPSSTSTTTTTG